MILGYSWLKKLKDPVIPAINAIPSNAVCLIKINNLKELGNYLYDKNQIWKSISKIPPLQDFQNSCIKIDSICKTDQGVDEVLKSNPMYMAVLPDRGSFNLLFCINLLGPHDEKMIQKFTEKHFASNYIISYTEFIDNRIFLVSSSRGKLFCYTIYKGIFIAAPNTAMVESSLSALNTGVNITYNKSFAKLESSAGKNVDANIYLNPAYFDNLFQPAFAAAYNLFLKNVSMSADFLEMDITVKSNEVLCNGYAVTNDTSQWFSKVFDRQEPKKIGFSSVCPENTAVMIFWSINNMKDFINNNATYNKTDNQRMTYFRRIQNYDSTYKIDIHDNFFKLFEDEIGYIVTHYANNATQYRPYAIFKAKDISEFTDVIKNLSKPVLKKSGTENTDSSEIYELLLPGMFELFLGKLFSDFDTAFYTTINEYVIFGTSSLSVELFISGYLSGKTLNQNVNYKAFSDNVSEEANFSFYVNFRKCFGMLKQVLSDDLYKLFILNKKHIMGFQAFAFQFAKEGGKYYLNAYLKHNENYVDENPAIWEFKADTSIFGKAVIVADNNSNENKVVFFDIQKKIYVVNQNGELLWKRKLDELPVDRVHLVYDYNKTPILIFNSEYHIYLIDLYDYKAIIKKIKLPYRATAGISVIDYDNNKNYRILIPCVNQRIYNYSTTMQPVSGWNTFKTLAIVKHPVDYFKIKNNEFLVARDKNGRVYFLNKKGNEILKNRTQFLISKNGSFVNYSDGNKNFLLTTDRTGKLIFIEPKGKVEVVTLNQFTSEHYFIYEDYNVDGKKDFIFFDLGKLWVYNHQKRKIAELNLDDFPGGKPVYIKTSGNNYFIVYPDIKLNRMILINQQGIVESSAYPLSSPFIESGSLYQKAINNLIVSDSLRLFNYIID